MDKTPTEHTPAQPEEIERLKKRSVSGAVSYFLRTIFLQVIGLVSAVVLSALLTPEDFGIYGFVVQIIGILIFFSDVGLAAALVQKKETPSNREYATAFTIQLLLSGVILLVSLALLASGILTAKIGAVGNWLLVALAISFPLATLKTIPSIILERKLEFNKLVIPQIVEQIVFHGVVIALAWKGFGVAAYSYAILARSISGVIAMLFLQRWSWQVLIAREALSTLLSFGLKFQANDLLARVKDQLFLVVLVGFLPIREFGYMQWAKNWSMYPYNLTVQNVMAITFPTFSRLQHEPGFLKRAIEKSLFMITVVIFPILIGMSIFLVPLLDLLPAYQKWYPAVPSFILFTLSIGWSAVSTPLTNTLNAVGEINQTLKLMVLWTVLTWVVTPLMIWFFGFTGVAVAGLLISFTSFLPIIYVKKIVPIEVWDQVWRQLAAAGAMAAVGLSILGLLESSWTTVTVAILASGLTYVMLVLLTGMQKLKVELLPLLRLIKAKY